MKFIPWVVSVAGMAVSVWAVTFISPDNETWVFMVQYALVPAVVICFMTLVLLVHPIGLAGLYSRYAARIFFITAVLYAAVLVFVQPYVIEYAHKMTSLKQLKYRLEKQYRHAYKLQDMNEAIKYIALYLHYFPNDDFPFQDNDIMAWFIDKDTPLDIVREGVQFGNRDRDSLYAVIPSVSNNITALSYINMGQGEMLQRAADYVGDHHFYAAQLLLTVYEKRFGADARSRTISDTVKKQIQNQQPSYSEQKRVQLQKQIQFLYSALIDSRDTEKLITAYYQSIALENGELHNAQLQWLTELFRKTLQNDIFFANVARQTLLKIQGKLPVMFVEPGDGYRTVWAASDVSFYENTVYLRDVDLIRIQGTATIAKDKTLDEGVIMWHIRTPYAKLFDGRLQLYSLEPGSIMARNKPEIITDNSRKFGDILPHFSMETQLSAMDVIYLQARPAFIQKKSAITIPFIATLWKKYSLPVDFLYSMLIETIIDMTLGVIVIFALLHLHMVYIMRKRRLYTIGGIILAHMPIVWAYMILKSYCIYVHTTVFYKRMSSQVFTMPVLITVFAALVLMAAFLFAMIQHKSKNINAAAWK